MSNNPELNLDVGTVLDDAHLHVVTFYIAEEEFGVGILDVNEIIRLIQITPVPNTAHFLEGVINLRGKVIPVVNLRKRFDLEEIENTEKTRIIVMELNQRNMGFLVDEVSEVLSVPKEAVEPPPSVVAGIEAEYISGVANMPNSLLILLDLVKLLDMCPLVLDPH